MQFAVEKVDLIDLELRGKYLATLPPLNTAESEADDETGGEEGEGTLA